MGKISINPEELFHRLVRGAGPVIIDVRRRQIIEEASSLLPAARWRPHLDSAIWAKDLPPGRDVAVYCVRGHNVSQLAAAELRSMGVEASFLTGGIDAWQKSGYPLVGKSPFAPPETIAPSSWVTRWRPKIDRIACPWFITRFVDPRAKVLFVEPSQVLPVAEELHATPFDIDGAPITHDGPRCSFDTLLDHFAITDKSLRLMAEIIRGADTADLTRTPQSAGLLAISLGISIQCEDDQEALSRGFAVYDALYAWANLAREETHNWPTAKPA
jgi:rhodanese-related sulfurtransferase